MKPKPWMITWGARTWTDDDVLAADLVSVQLLLGGSWENVDPWAGPAQLMAMIAALECRTTGRDLDEVVTEVKMTPADELLAAISARAPQTA